MTSGNCGRGDIGYSTFGTTCSNRYVILNGFLKQSRQTPRSELRRAERLRADYYRNL